MHTSTQSTTAGRAVTDEIPARKTARSSTEAPLVAAARLAERQATMIDVLCSVPAGAAQRFGWQLFIFCAS